MNKSRDVILVCSPHSGSACAPDEQIEALHEAGVRVVEVVPVSELPEERQGPRWAQRGVDGVIAAGGDGTVGTVATHIGDEKLTMGILPLGTANDVARSLGIPMELPLAALWIGRGQPISIDVGQVTDGQGRSRRFLHAATIGLNAEFARLATDVERRRRLGPFNYPASALEVLASGKSRPITLRLGSGELVEGPALQVAALNLPHLLGGTFDIALSDLGARDGKLAFLVVKNLLSVQRYDEVRARLETEEPEDVTVDGEIALQTPVDIELASARLQLWLHAGVANLE
jgi:diacylglycerol kinase family enzyme